MNTALKWISYKCSKQIFNVIYYVVFFSLTFSYSYAHHISENNKKWAEKITNGGYILVVKYSHRDKWENINAFDIYSIINNKKAEEKSYKSSACLSNKGKEQVKMLNNVFKFLCITNFSHARCSIYIVTSIYKFLTFFSSYCST